MRIGGGVADVVFCYNGVEVHARDGESVAAALLAAGLAPPMFCAIGICQLCVVTVDDMPVEACRLRAATGINVWSRP